MIKIIVIKILNRLGKNSSAVHQNLSRVLFIADFVAAVVVSATASAVAEPGSSSASSSGDGGGGCGADSRIGSSHSRNN